MDEIADEYINCLSKIARAASRQGDNFLRVNTIELINRVAADELQRAREYWGDELTAEHQRVIPRPPRPPTRE